MIQEKTTDAVRVNARKTDVFDVFNFKHYMGANPYLETGALVFSFALTEYKEPLPIEDYVSVIGIRYPVIKEQTYISHADLFARTLAEVGKLDMGLHLNCWSVKPYANYKKIGVQSLHERTTRSILYFVWDWFEAITQKEEVVFEEQMRTLQNRFRQSVYGGPQYTPYYAALTKKVFLASICGKKD